MSPDSGRIAPMEEITFDSRVPLSKREHLEFIEMDKGDRLRAMADGRVKAAGRSHRNRARNASRKFSRPRP